jgi:lysophospholipase L1-like esterase
VSLSGTVTDGLGNPVNGLTIAISSIDGGGSAQTVTASDGTYSFSVPEDRYSLTFDDGSYLPGGLSAQDSSLSVSSDTVQNIQLPATQTTSVVVTDSSGAPVGTAEVTGQNAAYSESMYDGSDLSFTAFTTTTADSCTTDSTGTCSVEGLLGGAMSVTATPPSGLAQTQSVETSTDPSDLSMSLTNFDQIASAGSMPGIISLSSPVGTDLKNVSAISIPNASLPPGYDAVSGDIGYEVTGLTPGTTIELTVRLPPGSDPTNILKLINGSYVDASSIATINGDTVSLQLTDGGFGDQDGVADGTIVDPLVPVIETPTTPPVVTSQPSNEIVQAGQIATFSAAASGSPTPTVQWQVSTDAGVTYSPIPGATSDTYSFPTTQGQNASLFEAVFSNRVGGPAITTPAVLSVVKPTRRQLYDAVGDSFTSQDSKVKWNAYPCEVAPTTYPSLVATIQNLNFKVLACSGATTANLLSKIPNGAQAPELYEVSPEATLVTIMSGINDLGVLPLGFLGELSGCEARNKSSATVQSCQGEPDMNEASLENEIASVSTDLTRALAWLQLYRPNAHVVVLDYPAIVPTPSCPKVYFLSSGDIVLYGQILSALNAAIETAAANANDKFIDLYHPSLGASGCPTWVEPGAAPTNLLGNHPTTLGVVDMASTISANLGSGT